MSEVKCACQRVTYRPTGDDGIGWAERWTCDCCGREFTPESEVARLRAELAAAREWRPIETAPRDGTPCLVYERDGYPHKMVFARCYPGDNEWHDQAEGDGYLPTHWLPLPEPPKDGGEG